MSYEVVKEITSFRDVANHFRDTEEESWLLLSTKGFHGTNWTLDRCDKIFKDEDEVMTKSGAYITVFIICPASVSLKWGEIKLKNHSEVDWLRRKVRESLDKIINSQEGNTYA